MVLVQFVKFDLIRENSYSFKVATLQSQPEYVKFVQLVPVQLCRFAQIIIFVQNQFTVENSFFNLPCAVSAKRGLSHSGVQYHKRISRLRARCFIGCAKRKDPSSRIQ